MNEMFSDEQKAEIMSKIKTIDKSQIESMLKNSNISNLDKRQIIDMINSVDKNALMEKLRRL